MSPEVVFKRPYNENIDVWSLGVLLYELLHGRSAFRAKNLNEITMKFRRTISLHFDESLSEEVKDLIKGILKLEPTERLSLKEIFEHKWVKKMYGLVDFDNYENKRRSSNFSLRNLKETQKTLNENKNQSIHQKSYNYIAEPEEKPFQTISMNRIENFQDHKKLYSFQALDKEPIRSKINSKLRHNALFEKENISEINISNHPKSKIFDLKLKKDSPDRVLKSMENLITDFELKLHHEKDFISLLHKNNYYDIK